MSNLRRAILVGCGGMGNYWLSTLKSNPRVQVAALVDIRLDAARAAAQKNGLDAAGVFDSLAAAVKGCSADFVLDVTVPEAHCPTTLSALKAGLPVIGEKPMAESMASARKMVAASDRARRLYMVSQSRRYEAHHKSCRLAVQSGTVGRLTTINCDFYIGAHFGGFRDQMPSPLILDMAIHHFDLCRYLTGADPVAVYAHEFNPHGSWYKGDVAASVIFEMTGGIVFTYRGSWCAEGFPTAWNGDWRIVGDRGSILMEKEGMPRAQRVKDPAEPGFSRTLEDVVIPKAELPGGGIAGSLAEFLDYLDTGALPQGECHDNIKSLAMVFAAIESSKKKRRVLVKPLPPSVMV